MSRENAAAKARRIVAEGRLTIYELDDQARVVRAEARGDAAVWNVGRDERGWFCDCPARGRCSHQLAVGLVVAIGGPS